MNRRHFLILSASVAGAMLLPLDTARSSPRLPIPTCPNGRPRRILYGSAGKTCAQFPNSIERPRHGGLPGAALVSDEG